MVIFMLNTVGQEGLNFVHVICDRHVANDRSQVETKCILKMKISNIFAGRAGCVKGRITYSEQGYCAACGPKRVHL